MHHVLCLFILPGNYAVCRLDPETELPAWVKSGEFMSITRTMNELSLVVPEESVPEGVLAEKGWRCLGVKGTLDFSLVGVLSALCRPLAEHQVSVFALSTYATDYLLVKDEQLHRAIGALEAAGHKVER